VKEFLINEKRVFLLTTRELVKATGLTSRTLRKWGKNGILPPPIAEEEDQHPTLGLRKARFYLAEQAEVLVWWIGIAKPHNGKKVPEELKNLLRDKWDEVTNRFLNKLEGVGI